MEQDHLDLPAGLDGGRKGNASRLRSLLESPTTIVVPGVSDALTARLVERAGFPVCFFTGAGFANWSFGYPDVGLVTMSEVAQQVGRVCDAVRIPVIADADNGYGGPLSVVRTVRAFERAGAAGIHIEDQPVPKRCGHFAGKNLVPIDEMLSKIHAARSSRRDPDTVIVARTDAIGVEGFEAAMVRAKAFRDAGADALLIEAPTSVEQLERIPKEIEGIPLVLNLVEGGRTPEKGTEWFEDLGYRVVLHANLVLRVMVKAASRALEHLAQRRDSAGLIDEMVTWEERQVLVDLGGFDALEETLAVLGQGQVGIEGPLP